MIVSVGFPTGMEGLTYPIPFSEPAALLAIAKQAEFPLQCTSEEA